MKLRTSSVTNPKLQPEPALDQRQIVQAALSLLERAGRELLDAGTLSFLDGAIGYADLQRRFES